MSIVRYPSSRPKVHPSSGHGGLAENFPRAPELYSPTGTVVPRGGGIGDICIVGGGESPSPDLSLESIQI